MVSIANNSERPFWFVGASYGGTDDQTERFLEEGIWENGWEDRHLDLVNSILPGDRIAIKKTYVRKNGLPFANRGLPVSVMAITATGIVTRNFGDGRHVRVDWTPVVPQREWYFYTYRGTIWKVEPGEWAKDHLISFAFDNQPQPIDRFRNDPYWRGRFGDPIESDAEDHEQHDTVLEHPEPPYTLDNIVNDGCFLERAKLDTMLKRLKAKQNIILQGPPGTGKTWLAKRLAYALVGSEDDDLVRPVQFHPNLSYEDFVRGWRPQSGEDGAGRLSLVDGPFLRLAQDARQDPYSSYVMVIEEINRGYPAQIFGEMLTLLESDKRNPDEALALAYPRADDERFHIPPNVYVIGTMNVADRSIALVDLALRRRFAFFDLEPTFGRVWRNWVSAQCGIDGGFLSDIERRLAALNEQIADDRSLGPQFRIGHSVVTPPPGTTIDAPAEWFKQVVETEITPLLAEYWFDNPKAADDAKSKLLAGA